ncbi:unnamed protein product [Tetraodon nigroviridis]|uniref:(spotted green pufferfish) hypothetical protein n=1 Tax=Tetraodon nigroviridis TaxID=99883 RepID=Q4RGP4_TETNG|nr:unnamed protein product [Tetraodon nigroviridis]
MITGIPPPPRNLPCQKGDDQTTADKIKKTKREDQEGRESPRLSESEIREGQRIISNAKKNCKLMKQVLLKMMNNSEEIGPIKEQISEGHESRQPPITTLQQENEQLQVQVKAMKTAFRDLSVNDKMEFNVLQSSLVQLKEEEKNLQVRLDEMECTSTEQQTRLKTTVDEQCEVIRTLNLHLTESEQQIKSLHFQIEENREFVQEYKNIMKEIERRQRLKCNKNLHPQVRKLICHNTFLMEKLNQSKNIISTQKAHCKHLQLQSLQLQTYIRRFEEELQACMSVITQPKLLKQKLTVLRRNYIDNPKVEQSPEDFETQHQTRIGVLEKRLERWARITRNNKNTRKQLEQKLSETVSTFSKKESEYITLLKVEMYKRKQMERELKKANVKVGSEILTTLKNSARSACSSATTQLDEETVEFYKIHCGLSELSYTRNTDTENMESETSHRMCETSVSEDSVGDEV